jgi:hypothetical protein
MNEIENKHDGGGKPPCHQPHAHTLGPVYCIFKESKTRPWYLEVLSAQRCCHRGHTMPHRRWSTTVGVYRAICFSRCVCVLRSVTCACFRSHSKLQLRTLAKRAVGVSLEFLRWIAPAMVVPPPAPDLSCSITANACLGCGHVGCCRHLQEDWGSQAAGLSYLSDLSCIPLPCSNSCVSSYLGANALCGITPALIRLSEFT